MAGVAGVGGRVGDEVVEEDKLRPVVQHVHTLQQHSTNTDNVASMSNRPYSTATHQHS